MITGVTEFLGTFLYPLFSIIFTLIIAIESMFYGFAGIGDVFVGNKQISSANSGSFYDTGIIYYLLTSDFTYNIFIALLALAIILLVLFAAIAFVRNMYSEKPKTWQDIIGNAVKGLMGFVVTPMLCIFGAWGGNILLKAINNATNPSSTTNLAGELFVVSAFNANRYRLGHATDAGLARTVAAETFSNKQIPDGLTMEEYADIVDECFAERPWAILTQPTVMIGYELFNINYLILGIGGVFMIYALGAITFGAIKRMFKLLFLLIISPLAHSMAPIDDGEAGKKVRSEFYKTFISIYGAVVGLNLFFSVLPIFQHIDIPINWASLWGGTAYAPGNFTSAFHGIFNLIIVIVGLLTVQELINMVSGWVGGDNLYSDGAGVMGSVKGQVKKYGRKVQTAGGAFVGGIIRGRGASRQRKEDIEAYRRAYNEEHGENAFENLSRRQRRSEIKDATKNGEISRGRAYTTAGSWFKSAKDAANSGLHTIVSETTGFDIGKPGETIDKWKDFKDTNLRAGRNAAEERRDKAESKRKKADLRKDINRYGSAVSDADNDFMVDSKDKDGKDIRVYDDGKLLTAVDKLIKAIEKEKDEGKQKDMWADATKSGGELANALKSVFETTKLDDVKERAGAMRQMRYAEDELRARESDYNQEKAVLDFIKDHKNLVNRDGTIKTGVNVADEDKEMYASALKVGSLHAAEARTEQARANYESEASNFDNILRNNREMLNELKGGIGESLKQYADKQGAEIKEALKNLQANKESDQSRERETEMLKALKGIQKGIKNMSKDISKEIAKQNRTGYNAPSDSDEG